MEGEVLSERQHDDSAMIEAHVTLMTQNRERSKRNAERLKEVEGKQDDVRERLPPLEDAMEALALLPGRFVAVEADIRANRWIFVTAISLLGVVVVVAQIILTGGG